MKHVIAAKGTKPSARLLDARLEELGYEGEPIRWGFAGKYADKGLALRTMSDAGVPTPPLSSFSYPIVARARSHRGGSGFWLCNSYEELALGLRDGASHWMEYIENAREFRVHIVDGQSIKLSEKIGGGITKNFKNGARFVYPHDFNHKRTLRDLARHAVEALELSFGAVDILHREGQFFVLEVNTGPSLTSKSDTLERYAQAFYNYGTELTVPIVTLNNMRLYESLLPSGR